MKVTEETVRRFGEAIAAYEKCDSSQGIGTLREKMLHSVMKAVIAESEEQCEVRIDGHNIADCLKNNTVYEVQTESLYPVRKKLDFYLENTDYDIDIVFPIARKKYTIWTDPESGEIISSGRAGKKRDLIDEIDEINYVAEYLNDPRVTFTVWYICEEELRSLDGKRSRDRKRGSSRIERRPVELYEGIELTSFEDLDFLLPSVERFTRKMYKTEKKIRSERKLYSAVNILEKCGFAVKDGKDGNAIVYKIVPRGGKELKR